MGGRRREKEGRGIGEKKGEKNEREWRERAEIYEVGWERVFDEWRGVKLSSERREKGEEG
jgi:hypothetical protein